MTTPTDGEAAVAALPGSTAPAVPAAPRGSLSSQRSKSLAYFATPAVLWYAIFMIGPLVGMFAISFYEWPGLIAPRTFIGLENFSRILGDPVFSAAARNTTIQVLIVVPVMIPLAFMLGYYLQLKRPGYRLLSVLCFTPGLISITAKAMIFFGVLQPNGALNGVLEAVGLEGFARPWLANPGTALATIIAVELWSGIGWTAVLFSARLASVSPEVYEAAQLDGASHWTRMWRIAYPISKEFVGVMTMLQFLWTLFSSAALVLLLTRGGPGTSSTTLSYLIYAKAFREQSVGYSQAVGVLLFVVGLVGMAVIRRLIRQNY